ncbi:hypothetical protein VPH35_051237 [Triticum aestivum]|uniref:DUF1618 domain-containing protein n=2 Tax=Triticum aestivum TaxID=4565 RepID=A0A3B6FKZ9_WHEAT
MAPPAWIILGAETRVSEHQDADLSLELAAPPRVSVLTVPRRVSPVQADPTSGACPWVVTADPAAGLLLLRAPPPPPTHSLTPPPTLRNGVLVPAVTYITRHPPTYFVCDVASATAFRLPQPGRDPSGLPPEINALNLGVVAAPGAGGGALRYMVVEFRYMFADEHATLLCLSSDTGEWVSKPVHNPLGRWIWGRDGVVAHDGKLWWVDLAGGLIFCNPFADAPVLDIIPLPESDCHLPRASCAHCAGRSVAHRRFVQVSAGKFRCVEWNSRSNDEAPMTVSMWTLSDPEAKEWVLEYKVSFQEIWADDSYKAAGLTEKNPTFALVHPMNPDVLYFFLEEHLFGVDLRAKRVVECGVYEMVVPPSGKPPNCFSVRALELPIALSPVAVYAGLLPSDVGSGSNGEESTPWASSVSLGGSAESADRV